MTFFKYIFLIVVFCGTTVFSQNVIKHKVKSGESIYSLAKKYDVKVADIYALNPSLKGNVLGLNAVVSIPNSKSVKEEKPSKKEKAAIAVETKKEEIITTNQSVFSHLVKKKETLYSISKKYGVTMESICEMNPELKTANLKVGALLILTNPNYIPEAKEEVKTEVKTDTKASAVVTKTESSVTADVTHKVQPKETLFKISKKYGVTVSGLQQLNPNIPDGLPVGYTLIVKKGMEVSKKVTTTTTSEKTAKEIEEEKSLVSMYSSKANYLIAKASENLGTPYRSGGITSAGFDCSGLMFSTFKNIDMILPRSSYEMASYGKKKNG